MTRLGNARRGVKRGSYVKLKGDEIVTESSTAKTCALARDFAAWFAEYYNTERGKALDFGILDEDVLHETFITVYDDIALKGRVVREFNAYFWRAYYTNRIASEKRVSAYNKANVPLSQLHNIEDNDNFAASDFNYELFEHIITELRDEIYEYVKQHYDAQVFGLFEAYTACYPDLSYKALAKATGVPYTLVWQVLGAVKKDIIEAYTAYKDFRLSVL